MQTAPVKYCGSAALVIVASLLIIRPALAQIDGSTNASYIVDTSSSTTAAVPPVATDGVSTAAPPAPLIQLANVTNIQNNLVEVKLACTESYTAPLYDTPSGHLDDGYFVGDAVASTTGMTQAHEIGEGAWTICHDARGHKHEFSITSQEYAALEIRGTPQRSVMESPKDAALDSFPSDGQ